MNKLFRRIVAYTVDMMVVLLITQCLAGIPQINRQLDEYNGYYTDYMNLYNSYNSFKSDLNDIYEDKELDIDEYNKLLEDNSEYSDILNEYYIDGVLTEASYEDLNEKIDNDYDNKYRELYYKIEKNSIIYFVIYLSVVVVYFVGFNMITSGQTLGKKLMRLKIVNNRNDLDKVPVWSYIVRALILYQPIYYLIRFIGINFMDMNMYYNVTSVAYDIQGYLEMLIIAMMMFRIDGRGPQDFLGMTRVALFDKKGNEVKDKLETALEASKKSRKAKKVIDEESTE